MLKHKTPLPLPRLLKKLGIKINDRFYEGSPLGYHRGGRVGEWGERNGLCVNHLSDTEVILSLEPVRLGRHEYVFGPTENTRTYYSYEDWLAVRCGYEAVRHLQPVPRMAFPEPKVMVQEHRPGVRLLTSSRPQEYRELIVQFVKDLHGAGYAHRDLHCKNIIVDDGISVVDWDFIVPNPCPLRQAYDLTGEGLSSPHLTGRAHIFKEYPIAGIPSVAALTGITWEDFR